MVRGKPAGHRHTHRVTPRKVTPEQEITGSLHERRTRKAHEWWQGGCDRGSAGSRAAPRRGAERSEALRGLRRALRIPGMERKAGEIRGVKTPSEAPERGAAGLVSVWDGLYPSYASITAPKTLLRTNQDLANSCNQLHFSPRIALRRAQAIPRNTPGVRTGVLPTYRPDSRPHPGQTQAIRHAGVGAWWLGRVHSWTIILYFSILAVLSCVAVRLSGGSETRSEPVDRSMLADLGEILSSSAIIVTLVFPVVETRQNTNVLHALSRQSDKG